MLEYSLTEEEGEEILGLRRALQSLGWQTGWDMQQDMVFMAATWILVAEEQGSADDDEEALPERSPRTVTARRAMSHTELKHALDPEGMCRAVVAEGWREVLRAVREVS